MNTAGRFNLHGYGTRWRRIVALLFGCVCLTCANAMGQSAPAPATSQPDDPFLRETIDNLLSQPVGSHTVRDLNLPEDFARRVAERILRDSFERAFRVVVRADGARPETRLNKGVVPAGVVRAIDGAIEVVDHAVADEGIKQARAALREARPPARGFRFDLEHPESRWPFEELPEDAPPEMKQAAEIVARRLAFDGLLPTTAQAIKALGPEHFSQPDPIAMDLLKRVGLPVDLFPYFKPPEKEKSIVAFIAEDLMNRANDERLGSRLGECTFEFEDTRIASIDPVDESGGTRIAGVRVQLTRGDYWEGINDGGNLHVLRQLTERIPDARFVASIERTHAATFESLVQTWPLERARQVTLVVEDVNVSQWAQDNGKYARAAIDGAQRDVLIVPRYASRGDDGSTFVPGDSFVWEGLEQAGVALVQSPLLFQGGNLMIVRHPGSGEHTLLIGESEIHRNRALGLTAAQALEMFRRQFGVDRCCVLPAVSFHIDFDLCVRAVGDRLVAFVLEVDEGVVHVLRQSAAALERHGLLKRAQAADLRTALDKKDWREIVSTIGPIIHARDLGNGHFPLSFAEQFTDGPEDSAVGNFQRVLLALDHAAVHAMQGGSAPQDPNLHAYLKSLARTERDRADLHQMLREQGFEIVPVPGLPGEARAINPLNGLHAPGAYLMSAYGGFFAPLDEAATEKFRAVLGADVRVIPIYCSESQRRVGGVHCSTSVIPAVP